MPQNLSIELENKLTAIYRQYLPQVEENREVKEQLTKVYNRAREHRNSSFIILVVGPVKSGKSTLVNLIANSYVSPTNFLECTVRPSIISRLQEGESSCIEVYRSLYDDNSNSAEQVEQIIDCLRGLIAPEEIEQVTKEAFQLTEENINKHVALNLLDANSDTTLMTSIQTPGGELLKRDVFIVDMPGFDGAYANLDNPVYARIADRADLIIFVQSSNSAISKVSTKFLRMLQKNNGNVPVCLLHNVFEAAHWRSDEQKQADIHAQKQFAISEIQRQGFVINEQYAFSINLGMIADYRKGNYRTGEESLQREAAYFAETEQRLYNLIIAQRESIRIKNCINRTRTQKQVLENCIATLMEKLEQQQQAYTHIVQTFDRLKKEELTVSRKTALDVEQLKRQLKTLCQQKNQQLAPITNDRNDKTEGAEYRTEEARKVVEEFRNECEELIRKHFEEQLQQADNLWNDNEAANWKSEINQVLSDYGLVSENIRPAGKEHMADIPLTLPGKVDDLVQYQKLWYKHTPYMMQQYIQRTYEMYAGNDSYTPPMSGYLETNIAPKLKEHLKAYTAKVIAEICSTYNRYIEEKMQAVLKHRKIDINLLKQEWETLNSLQKELTSINIPQQ